VVILKAVIYTRVSSTNQAEEGYSLEAQYEQLIKYVDEEGMELVKVYTDPGVSAKSLNRPGIQELISDLKSGKFETLIIHKLDRLTRNISDLYDLVEMVTKYNVKLISLNEKLDTSTPMGRMFIYMLGILAQMFRENLAQEIIKGQSMRASKGLRVSPSRPYGYDLGENLAMTINEEEAYLVRQIFQWFNAGYNLLTICKKINAMKITKKFHQITVQRIVSNPTYIGVNHWKRKGSKEGVYFERAHEPIISEDTFQTAQDILSKRKDHFLSQSMSDFCFSTVFKCGVCGRSFSGYTRRENGWEGKSYRCTGIVRHGCKVGSISEKKLTAIFLDFISNYSIKASEPQKILSGRDLAKDRKRLEKLLADSAAVKKNYLRAYGTGKIEFDIFTELAAEEDKKSEEWKTELDTINQMSPSGKKTRKDVLLQLENLKTNWDKDTVLERKMNISQIFKFLVIRPENGVWNIVAFKTHE
jgi:site-specific DNA recombinase